MHLLNRLPRAGFTLIELLVVVALIGILSLMVLFSTGEAKERAVAAAFLQQLDEIDKALLMYAIDNQPFIWPNTGTGYSNINSWNINNLVATGGPGGKFNGFDEYFPQALDDPAKYSIYSLYNRDWALDCDPSNSNAHASGVSIRVGNNAAGLVDDLSKVFAIMDENVDRGDGKDCGRVRWGGTSGSLYYLIAEGAASL